MIQETDDDVFAPVRDSFAGVDLDTPLDSVIGRGRRVRRRRRTLAGAATMGVAAVAAVALAVPSATAPATPAAGATAHSGPAGHAAVHIQLAGWSMQSNANGTVTLTFHDFTDLPQLRQALAQAGIHAVVQDEFPTCGPGAPGVHQLPTGNAVTVSIDQSTYTVTETINPAALPAGSVLRLAGVQLNNTRLAIRKADGQVEQLPVIGVQTALYSGQPAADQCDQDSTIQAFFGPTSAS
jgi:hypothetical protein